MKYYDQVQFVTQPLSLYIQSEMSSKHAFSSFTNVCTLKQQIEALVTHLLVKLTNIGFVNADFLLFP